MEHALKNFDPEMLKLLAIFFVVGNGVILFCQLLNLPKTKTKKTGVPDCPNIPPCPPPLPKLTEDRLKLVASLLIRLGYDHQAMTVCEGAVEIQSLRNGLEELVKLQSHYAELLNMHDGGQRICFKSADDWLDRLHELKQTPVADEKIETKYECPGCGEEMTLIDMDDCGILDPNNYMCPDCGIPKRNMKKIEQPADAGRTEKQI